jgi:hypothetical protein
MSFVIEDDPEPLLAGGGSGSDEDGGGGDAGWRVATIRDAIAALRSNTAAIHAAEEHLDTLISKQFALSQVG